MTTPGLRERTKMTSSLSMDDEFSRKAILCRDVQEGFALEKCKGQLIVEGSSYIYVV